ncbi:MAG: hypothetical protein E7158_06525 [Firmicutes bacterium]|nr:hypothetical protein [Bacillota bacterium]
MQWLYEKIANGVIKEDDLKKYFNMMVNTNLTLKQYNIKFDTIDNGSITSYDRKSRTLTVDISNNVLYDIHILEDRVKYNLNLIKEMNNAIAVLDTERLLEDSVLYQTDPEVYVCLANEYMLPDYFDTPLSNHINEVKSDFYTLKVLFKSIKYGVDSELYNNYLVESNSKILSYIADEKNKTYSLLERTILSRNNPDSIYFSLRKYEKTKSRIENYYSGDTARHYKKANENIIDRAYIRNSNTIISRLITAISHKERENVNSLKNYSLANKLLFGKRLSDEEIIKIYETPKDMSILENISFIENDMQNKKLQRL